MAKNCGIYVRKSKVNDNSDSMETQIQMCTDYLNQHFPNCTITIYDKDYGITGHSIDKRKDFQRMMDDVKSGLLDIIAIQRYDRIARNTRDFCNLYHDMEINGCNLVSVSQQIDTTTPYGKNFMYMQASMAELEWALNSERRKDANRYARSIGKCTLPDHSIPMGYKAERIDGIRRLVKDKEKEPLIYDLFEHFSKYSNYCATAKYINAKYGLSITNNTVKNTIRRTYYYGTYHDNPSFCEPYLTKEEWDKLQIHKPVVRFDARKTDEILFSGMIRCPHCNCLMRACKKTKPNGHYFRYYHCEYHSSRRCDYRKVKSENIIEKMLVEKVSAFLENQNAYITEQVARKKDYESLIIKYEEELSRLNTMFLKGRISEEIYDTEYLRITDLIRLNKANTQPQEQIKQLENVFVENWQDMYNELDKMNKKLFWKAIIKQIVVDEDMNVINVIFL